MYGYILLDIDNIVVEYKSLTSKIEDNKYIYVGMNLNLNDLLYRKYDIENKTFSDEKYYPVVEEVLTLDKVVEEQGNKISILEGENEKLKVEQEQQNEEILVNMLANTEMFEMLLGMIPMSINENKGGNSMIEVYVTLIIKGVKTVEDVPLVIREQVIERLKQLEVPVK